MAVWVSCFVFPIVIIGVVIQFIYGLIRKYIYPNYEDVNNNHFPQDEDSRKTSQNIMKESHDKNQNEGYKVKSE